MVVGTGMSARFTNNQPCLSQYLGFVRSMKTLDPRQRLARAVACWPLQVISAGHNATKLCHLSFSQSRKISKSAYNNGSRR